jgi:hypothetical protein
VVETNKFIIDFQTSFAFFRWQFPLGSALISARSKGEIFSVCEMCISSTIHDFCLQVVYSHFRNLLFLVFDSRKKSIFLFWYLLNPTENQSWVTSSRFVFLNNMLIIEINTAHRSSTIVLFNTKLLFSPVQISDGQVDVGYKKE